MYKESKDIMMFHKITTTQYWLDKMDNYIPYNEIKLPKRATKCSAGYDIYSVTDFTLQPGESIKLPTGIHVHLDDNKFLAIVPRSGLGFKFRTQLDNTIGIIDADYVHSDNEGHIWVKITNDSKNGDVLEIKQGDAICQGIIMQYFTTEDDNVTAQRNGGFGSTSK
jgi:dUTP pyrophosphatase